MSSSGRHGPVRWDQAAIIFSFARGIASTKVCIGVLIPLLVFAVAMIGLMIVGDCHELLAGLGVIAVVVTALSLRGVSPFAVIVPTLLAIVATFLGVFDSLRGKTYQTWTPANSRDLPDAA